MSDKLVLDGASEDKDERDVVLKFDPLLDKRSFHRWGSVPLRRRPRQNLPSGVRCSAGGLSRIGLAAQGHFRQFGALRCVRSALTTHLRSLATSTRRLDIAWWTGTVCEDFHPRQEIEP